MFGHMSPQRLLEEDAAISAGVVVMQQQQQQQRTRRKGVAKVDTEPDAPTAPAGSDPAHPTHRE